MSQAFGGRPGTCRLLVITGTMGAGKTTMMTEASDILTANGRVHAAIDLDALGVAWLPDGAPTADIATRNLMAVWPNFAERGIDSLLLAAALETRADLDNVRHAVNASSVSVCRLRAPLPTLRERVRVREPGMLRQRFIDRIETLESILDAAALEDFALTNGDGSITAVAHEMLVRAGWL
jgi:hypothetical protein